MAIAMIMATPIPITYISVGGKATAGCAVGVGAAGHPGMYLLHKVAGGRHGDPVLMTPALQIHFPQLIDWVENNNPAPPSVT